MKIGWEWSSLLARQYDSQPTKITRLTHYDYLVIPVAGASHLADARWLAVGSWNYLQIYDLDTGEKVANLQHLGR
ncbi:MAG: hypothetical protein RMK92_03800 [Armatimonadota bacterium]|nr:hypothetical protein [Armatimonadota bacterium]